MKSLLLRFWQWLGRLLGQDTKASATPQATGDTPGEAAPQAQTSAPPAVTLPPPLPPQMDLHADEAAQHSRKASILTPREGRFYPSLLSAVGSDYTVMSKVRLWDFIKLENDPPERKQYINRLSCRHVDFLLCEPVTLKPLLVIELDDSSHQDQNSFAADNDRYKNELFANAGMPLLRLPRTDYSPRQLRNKIEEALEN